MAFGGKRRREVDRGPGGGETEQEGARVGVWEQWSETQPLSKFETLADGPSLALLQKEMVKNHLWKLRPTKTHKMNACLHSLDA